MKINKLFKALGLILQKPYLLNEVLHNEERFKKNVQTSHAMMDGLPVIDFRAICIPDINAAPYAFLDGGSLPTDLILLKSLVSGFDACSYFEIGTWRGESVANVAQLAAKCFTLNQSVEEMRALGLSEQLIKQLRFFSAKIPNVQHLTGNSCVFDFSPYFNKMDVVFIDGDHSYEGVKNDTQKILPLLKNEDSVIVWHDYAHNPDTVRWEVLQGILDALPTEMHQHLYAVSNTKCAVFSRKQWNTKKPQSPSTPDKTFEVSLRIN